MAAKSIILSVNDYPNTTDYLNLVDGNNYICPPDDGFSAPPPAVHRYHSRTKGTLLTTEDFRTVTLKLQVFGGAGAGSADTLLANIAALEKKGRQARLYSGPTPRGIGPVSLAVRFSGATNYTYFDVQDILVTADTHVYGPVNMQTVTVMLTCLPWARGVVIQDALSPIIVNGASGYLFRAGVMGDTDAIAQLQIVDNALSSQFINRIHVGRMAGDGLRVSDFTPVTTNLTPISPATTIAGTGVLSGTAARLATSAAFTPVCSFAQPSGNYQSGFNAHAYAVVRDNSIAPTSPTITSLSTATLSGNQALSPGLYSIQLSSISSAGVESPASATSTITVTQNGTITVNLTPVTGASFTYIYMTGPDGVIHRYILGGTQTSYTIVSLSSVLVSAPPNYFAPPSLVSDTGVVTTNATVPSGTYNFVFSSSTTQQANIGDGPQSTLRSVTVSGSANSIQLNVTPNLAAPYFTLYLQTPAGVWSAQSFPNTVNQILITAVPLPLATITGPSGSTLSAPGAPTGYSFQPVANGTLLPGLYNSQLYTIDPSTGNLSYLTGSPKITLVGTTSGIQFNWTPLTGAYTTALYLQTPSGSWYIFAFGPGVTSTNILSLGSSLPLANYPNASCMGGIEIAGAAGQWLDGNPSIVNLGGSKWELLYLGVFPFAPMHQQEGQNKPSWTFRVQAAQGQFGTGNVDVAGLVLIPDDEPHLLAEYRGLAIPAAYTWILDDPRDRYVSGGLQSAGNYVGAVRAAGELRLAPGNNLVPIICEGPGGIFDSTNIRYQAALRYVPLYAFMRGADSDQSVLDLFDRANNASSLGIADSGQTYNVTGGTFGVENNHFYVNTVTTSNKAFAYINAAYANGVIRCTLVNVGAGASYLVFRLLDTSHYYALFASAASGYQLYSNVAGTLTNITSNAQPAQSGDQLVVTLNGTTVSVSVNGLALSGLQNVSIPNNSTAVGVGLGGNNAASETWNNWSMGSA